MKAFDDDLMTITFLMSLAASRAVPGHEIRCLEGNLISVLSDKDPHLPVPLLESANSGVLGPAATSHAVWSSSTG